MDSRIGDMCSEKEKYNRRFISVLEGAQIGKDNLRYNKKKDFSTVITI